MLEASQEENAIAPAVRNWATEASRLSGKAETVHLLGDDVCEPEACAPFVHNVMQALSKVVMSAAERHQDSWWTLHGSPQMA